MFSISSKSLIALHGPLGYDKNDLVRFVSVFLSYPQ